MRCRISEYLIVIFFLGIYRMNLSDVKIAVIGLGYVGLPLARLFSTTYPTVGFDINKRRIDELMSGHDSTL